MDHRESFERDGPELVRLKLNARQYNSEITREAVTWLAEQDQRTRRKSKITSRISIALEIVAATSATIGAIAAIVGAIAAIRALHG